MTTLEMKEKRAEITKKMEGMLNTIQSEKRAFSDEEQKSYAALEAEKRQLDDRIDNYENWLKSQKPEQKRSAKRFSFASAISALVEGRSLGEAEDIINKIGAQGMQATSQRSIFIPLEKRAALQAKLATAGVEDVSTDLLDLVTPLENELIARQAGATFLTGLRGNIAVPYYTGTNAGWAGEIAAASDGSGTFKQKTLAPKRITAYIDISKQLLIQANDSVEAYLGQSLVTAVNEVLESTMFGNGAGSEDKPAGLFEGVQAAKAAPTYGTLVNAETALYKNNFKNLAWVGAYDAIGILKQTEKSASTARYLLENNMVDGRPIYGSNNVTPKGLILGDFSELTIGQWGGIEVTVDPYTQAVNGMVRLVVNAYFDYFVRRGFDKNGRDVVPFTKMILQ